MTNERTKIRRRALSLCPKKTRTKTVAHFRLALLWFCAEQESDKSGQSIHSSRDEERVSCIISATPIETEHHQHTTIARAALPYQTTVQNCRPLAPRNILDFHSKPRQTTLFPPLDSSQTFTHTNYKAPCRTLL